MSKFMTNPPSAKLLTRKEKVLVKEYAKKLVEKRKLVESNTSRIAQMVASWKKEGRAFSNINNDDDAFFKAIKISPMEIGTSSSTGNDLLYYDTELYNSMQDASRGKKKLGESTTKNKVYNHFTDKFGNEYKFDNYMEFSKFWFNLSRKAAMAQFPKDFAKLQNAAANSKEARTKVESKQIPTTNKLNESVAQTILQQLGGRKFIAMTGATCMTDGEYTLIVKFKGSRVANIMYITLNGKDLYDVKICKYSGMNVKTVKEVDDVYADMLRDIFEKTTGLRTSL